MDTDQITAPIKDFARISGLGESTVRLMIRKEQVETVVIGRRRLVVIESFRKLIADQLEGPPQDARRNDKVPRFRSSVAPSPRG